MKILVLGGSPKGEKSVTMQYVRFLEREEALFAEVVGRVRAADLVLWASCGSSSSPTTGATGRAASTTSRSGAPACASATSRRRGCGRSAGASCRG